MPDSSVEIWKPIPGLEGHYEASSLGRIRSLKRGKVRIMSAIPNGRYLQVMICMDGKYGRQGIHRLVCAAFYGPASGAIHACHYDGDAHNNQVSNLRWGTPLENADDLRRHGRHRNGRKTHCKRGHEFTPENTATNKRGARLCKTCRRAYFAEWSSRNIKAA